VRVNPSDPQPVDLVVPYELDDFGVCNQVRLVNDPVSGEKLCAISAITDE
jgi:hypothetical protein